MLIWKPPMPDRKSTMLILIVGLCALASSYWAKGFWYLIDGPAGQGAIDLRVRWVDQRYVLHRQNPFDVYFTHHGAAVPAVVWHGRDASVIPQLGAPAAVGYPAWSYFSGYVLFWPSWQTTRVYYAAIQLICLLWLVRWAFLQGRQVDAWCGAFCASAVAATASFCTTLANGQYGILVLALLAAALQLDEAGWPCTAGLLAGVACLKPNITGPFLLCFAVRRRWRVLSMATGYLSIASLWIWVAVRTNPLEMLGQMLRGGADFAQTGYGLVSVAIALGMKPATATPIIALSVMSVTLVICLKYRKRPALELFAVAGVAARFWTYHQTYDNLSVIFLLVALARKSWVRGTPGQLLALGAVGVSLWLPAKFTDLLWFQVVQCFVWIAGTVVMLIDASARNRGYRDSDAMGFTDVAASA